MRFRTRQRYRLRVAAIAVIEPRIGVQEILGERRGGASPGELVDAIGELLMRTGLRSVGGEVEGSDRSEADQLREVDDRFQQRTAIGTKFAYQFLRASLSVEADPARSALVMGHGTPFRSVTNPTIPEVHI